MSVPLSHRVGRVIWPALRASRGLAALDALAPLMERYPPGGVIVFGEGEPEVEQLIATLRERAGGPLLVSSDLERGCGQQVCERSRLPPAMAIAACADENAAYEAGLLTGVEARDAGIDLVYAPVADVNTAATNPIIATRSFGDDPHRVARLACAFARGVTDGGALPIAKHFPGHGSTVQDSHSELARVTRDHDGVHGIDLLPFRALIAQRVAGLMVGHLEVPALDPVPGRPATASPAIVRELLRERLGYDGLLVTDALDMGGFRQEPTAPAAALAAGMDVLLMPADPLAAAQALEAQLRDRQMDEDPLDQACARIEAAHAALASATPPRRHPGTDLGERLHAASLTTNGRAPVRLLRRQSVDLQVFGEDEGGFVIAAFKEALAAAGVSISHAGLPLALVLTSVRAWAGSSRLPERSRERLHWAVTAGRLAQVVVLGTPYELIDLPDGCPALLAYEASPAAAFAAVGVLAGRGLATGKLPVVAGS